MFPIAVVGLSCRFPGAADPAAFWRVLAEGIDALGEAPPGRPATASRAGYLDDVAGFDAALFGVSPREARELDPQQRLLLELGWEVFEDAGIAPDALSGSGTGVFVGATADDYALLAARLGAEIGHHRLTGTSRALLANRLSHFFGLAGPSLAVDTGQSSALVAVHLAAESLRSGESALAIAGGVHLNLADESTEALTRLGALSPDGRCHTFDARANGFARGEGGGLVLLKPLARAEADGDRIYGVLRGTAVNNDGPAPGLTAPSPAAQERVLRAAYHRAEVTPAEIEYVELHGTGTAAGDPVEAAALGAAHAAHRSTELLVGSVKTNIGHLEGAAGIAGLLKCLLALHHHSLPASLNFAHPNPAIRFGDWRLRVVTETTPWPSPGYAGVSSFGIGGTNAHVVVAPAPDAPGPAPEPDGPAAWVLSAHTERALLDQATRLAGHLREHPGTGRHEIAASLVSRAALPRRAVVVGDDRDELVTALEDLAAGLSAPAVVRGTARERTGGIVFVFPGQGAQWPGMATELLDTSPVFADELRRCDDALRPLAGWSLVDVLRDAEGAPSMELTEVNQPVMWAVMVALAALWRSRGIEPAAVVGQSQGEVAAACVAGALTLEDGARLIEARARITARALTGRGGMAWLGLPVDDVRARLARWGGRLSVAVISGPASVVVAGDLDALDDLVAACEPEARARRIMADYASHSAAVEPVEHELKAALAGLRPMAPAVPFYSTVTGDQPTGPLDAEYWYQNLRQPVNLRAAVGTLLGADRDVFVEVSPHPMLLAGIRDCALEQGGPAVTVPTLRRGAGGPGRLLLSLGELYASGVPVRWPVHSGRRVPLPHYAFQRERHWLDDETAAAGPVAADPAETARREIAAVLGVGDPGRLELDAPFRDLGFDSSMLVELAARLGTTLDRRLTSTTLYNHPTPARLIEFLGADAPAEITAGPAPADDDPVVIVGLGCRFPGGIDSPESFWAALAGGADLVTGAPADRGWPDTGFRGGFLADAGAFDAGFFGISPREALAMDPQQRLLLETSWEALERAGLDPASLRGTETGVFFGLMAPEYGSRLHESGEETGGHVLTGVAPSVASGRVAYVLGTEGPAVTVDTACSSSLVALHLAAQSLRSGECTLALAGGATVMAGPGVFVEFARQGGLSGDGRCRSFAADADGTGWAEGAGVVVLQRLSAAREAGRPVLAVLRGSAVNQDGASNGLSAPNGLAQERVIRRALRDAGLKPSEVDAVEAHGTGTVLGDPIEAEALLATYGQQRETPLRLGSVKSNFGHAQAAAGVAGLIKMILAMRHRTLPATLHAGTASDRVDWTSGRVRLLDGAEPWEPGDRPLRAGISSFGISGTNAHVIIESAAPEPPPVPVEHGVLPLVVSGRTRTAVRAQALRLAPELDGDFAAVAWSLLATRTLHRHRTVVLAADAAEAATALRDPAAISGEALTGAKTVFVFPGQGAQWAGMGRELWDAEPVFAARMAECERALSPFVDWSLRDIVFGGDLDRVDVVQPVSWAVMVSLAALWDAHGVRPDAVIGHSQGEIAAAVVAGALSLADAARVVARRSQVIAAGLAGRGGLLSVAAGPDDVPEGAEIAAVNGPRALVLAGTPAQLDGWERDYRERGVRVRRVAVDYASHSSEVDSARVEVLDATGVTARTPAVPWMSTVDATWVGGPLSADYWFRNLRSRVRFADAVTALAGEGFGLFVEVSAHPVLTDAVADNVVTAAVCGTLRRDDGGSRRFRTSLAEHFVRGGRVDWTTVVPAARPVPLPTSVFERRRYWLGPDGVPLGSAPLARLTEFAGFDDADQLLELVRAHAAAVLGEPDGIGADRVFRDLGFDSLTSVDLRARLSAATGLALPPAVAFDFPTPRRLAGHLGERLAGGERATATARTEHDGDPIAVVGMGVRLPGGITSPADFWRLLADGGDAVSDFPADRGWDLAALYDADPDATGTTYTRRGGFLTGAGAFDAGFFGISPREALAMDPQQRLVLETAWEALEDAGFDPASLRDSDTGVFVGATPQPYGPSAMTPGDAEGYLLTGGLPAVISGRLAYVLGTQGPALTVDTACSSSLVALHLAARSLRSGETSLAVAGGVTVMAGPEVFVEFSRQRGLAPDGRCKSFSADADGTGWSEGAGMLVLQRLSDAQRDGREILAVLRGSAVNQDGASNGLTAPNGPAQEKVIRLALADAGLQPSEVDAVEAHGTGTVLGDPIEAQALLATYGRERDRPLFLGSAKSNVGHTQAAAGVVGVIKVVLAMRHGVLPRTLHAGRPSEAVDWASGPVELLTSAVPWDGETRRAGVSSFGVSGTNAHVLLEQPPRWTAPTVAELDLVPVVVTGRTERAVRAQAAAVAGHLAENGGLTAIAGALVTTRSRWEHRAVVLAGDVPEAIAGLRDFERANVVTGRAGDGGLGFVFPGQGSQRAGMGRELHDRFPVYAEAFDEVCAELDRHVDFSVREAVFDGDRLDETLRAQAGLFAVEVAMAALVASWGIRPRALAGHSLGELTAAFVAGVWSLPDAARLVAARGALMQALPAGGAMVSVPVPESAVSGLAGVSVAAVNDAASVVLSGPEAAVTRAVGQLGVAGRRLRVSHAFHSELMEPMLAGFREVAASLAYRPPGVAVVSTVTGERLTDEQACAPDYWVEQVRRTVRFADAAATMTGDAASPVTTVLELGPGGALSGVLADVVAVPLNRRGRPEVTTALTAAATAFARGHHVDWNALLPRTLVPVPKTVFDRQHYWLTDGRARPEPPLHVVRWEPGRPGPAVSEGVIWRAPSGDLRTVLAEVLDTVRRFLADAHGGRLAVVTEHADVDPVAAAVGGLVRSAQSEHPGRFVLADVEPGTDPDVLRRALGGGAEQLRIRSGEVLVPHLREVAATGGTPWRRESTVLITGGTGTLGSLVARHLVTTHGVGHVVLASRRGEDTALRTELEAAGAAVTMVSCDVADREQVRALLAKVPVTAVVHAAGVTDDGTITALDDDSLDTVLRPKADAAAHLDELAGDLDAFVLFSSAAGVLGSAGQAGYAAANAYLDALAARRRATGRHAVSLAWGQWAPVSAMTGRLGAADTGRLERAGVGKLSAAEGLRLLDLAVTSEHAALVAVKPAGTGLPRLGTPEEERADVPRDLPSLRRVVCEAAAAVLSTPAVDETRAFRDAGFDSLTALELRNRLGARTGLALPATLVFDYPNPVLLAEFLHRRLAGTTEVAATQTSTVDDDPVVIVGLAVRLPGGVATPEDYWTLLAGGVDAVSEFPADRGWDLDRLFGVDGCTPRHGGFLHDAAWFDAELFGISPREAGSMDPQQRLVLETSWEALERSGVDPTSLRTKDVGVFLGAATQAYGTAAESDGYQLLGTASSVLSGRLSYVLGTQGPAVTVDTACSSSLVALHLAAQSLRSGECSMAVAGGVTVMAAPDVFVEFSRQRGLSPDGRCKAFADSADGTAWAEGVGVLVLQRLSDAQRDGREILAVVRGSAVNQDGASNGLTAPNGPAQEKVIRQALANARLEPSEVDVVEAHGTGTALGDPIEAQALLNTYGRERDRPLWLGSVKSNVGHTQAAAGVAGVIKMVLSLRHGLLPRTLHVDRPSGKVDWTAGPVELLTSAVPWAGEHRRAGVSSFGVSGTNAHVIIEEPPVRERPETAEAPALVVSARTAAALRDQAARVGRLADPVAAAFSLAAGRPSWPHRAVALSEEALHDFVAGRPTADVLTGVAAGSRRPVLVFPGQGAQWVGMGRELWESEPVFAARMEECAQALASIVDWSVRDVVFGGDWDRVDVVQPVSWAVMVSLAALWRSCGITPDAVVGHSQGEIAAACVAGALSLEDAARVVAVRSQVIAAGLAGRGGMLSVAISPDEVPEGVEIAAVNGPRSVVLAGSSAVLDEVERRYREDGVRVRRIEVDYASHTAQVDTVVDEILARLGEVKAAVPEIPWMSTVDVKWAGEVDAAYWVRNLREPVRFSAAVTELGAQGFDLFVEASSHPVLTAAVLETVPDAVAVGSLRRDDGGPGRFVRSLAEVFVHGGTVDWRRVVPEAPLVDVPTTAFERERYWRTAAKPAGDVTGAGLEPVPHPVLGAFAEHPETGGGTLTGRLSLETQPWLADHAVAGAIVVPGAAWAELALQGGLVTGCPVVEELVVETPLVLDAAAVPVQVVVGGQEDGRRPVSVHAKHADGRWTRHATGTLAASGAAGETFAWPPPDAEPVADLYPTLAAFGYEYGPAFQGVRSLRRRGDELFAEVTLPEEVDATGFAIHPALLDATLHPAALGATRDDGRIELPFAWQGLSLHSAGRELRVRLRRGEVTAVDLDGRPVFTLAELTSRPVDAGNLRPVELFQLDWVPVDLPPGEAGDWRVFRVDPGPGADATRARHAVTGALQTVQKLLADGEDTRLVVVTREAQTDPAEAAVWGLVRAAQAEHPGRLVLLDGEGADPAAVAAAAHAQGENQVSVRDGQFFAPRLAPVEARGSSPLDVGTKVLITGGTGTLGTLVAEHLAAEHGVRDIVLASRSGTSDRFETRACDVSDRDQVRALLAETAPDVVVHAAGVLADGLVGTLDATALDRVFGPKVDAFTHLDELTRDSGTALIVFSSAAGVLGNAGQANYAAANAFLDAAITRRRAAGGAGMSLAWGLWAPPSAMTGHLTGEQRERMARAGVAPIEPALGMRMFDAALSLDAPVVVPVLPDRAALRAGASPRMWRGLVTGRRETVSPEAELLDRLSELDGPRRLAALTDLVRREAAVVLGRPRPIEPGTAFRELGFDSLTSVELRNRLGAATGARLPVTAVFDHPNAAALGDRLHAELFGSPESEAPVVAEVATLAEMDAEDLIRRALGEL